MTIQSRAYDNADGAPVIVLAVSGLHDVSRIVDTLRRGTVEHAHAAARLVRQVNRHNGGRAALTLLRRHGGPDLLDNQAHPHNPELDAFADAVAAERRRQLDKWGDQRHPDGTGGPGTRQAADQAREHTEICAHHGTLGWLHILKEEVFEAFAESDPDRLRAELVQVAAVTAAWLHDLDRRAEPADTVPADLIALELEYRTAKTRAAEPGHCGYRAYRLGKQVAEHPWLTAHPTGPERRAARKVLRDAVTLAQREAAA